MKTLTLLFVVLIGAGVGAYAKFMQIIQVGDELKINELKPDVTATRPRDESYVFINKVACLDSDCKIICWLSGYGHGACLDATHCRCWN